jgi:cell fate regulator YaaT (PSP1 superfamily)
MKQIGARQEAGLIGGLGVCGRALCCSNYISSFHSITTQAARCQDLSLNPQKLAGQCGKLKCCINYEAAVYTEAHSKMPHVNMPLELEDGDVYLVKTNVLKDTMWFSYEKGSMTNMVPLNSQEIRHIIHLNRKGIKAPSIREKDQPVKVNEFVTSVGDEKIDRFDKDKKGHKPNKKNHNRKNNRKKGQGQTNG